MAAQKESKKKRVCVTGAGGFIASHLAKRLKDKEHCYVIGVDRKKQEFFKNDEFCDEFIQCDLRSFKNCMRVTKDCDEVYNLAADMGGMGFIQSNEAVLMWNNTMISGNVLEASRRNKVRRFFYSSSACAYNQAKQLKEEDCGLKEEDAWPAHPQDTYGLEKLYAEEMAVVYGRDFANFETRIARFHNIYGPFGTWKDGREKAPAAFCRKAAVIHANAKANTKANTKAKENAGQKQELEIWGNGKQTRSFCYIDDCVEGIIRIMRSDHRQPLNLGSDQMISINELARLALACDDGDSKAQDVTFKHIEGPEGVRGRNSDNTLIKETLGWAPSIDIADGLRRTYAWVKEQVRHEHKTKGASLESLMHSHIVKQSQDMLNDFEYDA